MDLLISFFSFHARAWKREREREILPPHKFIYSTIVPYLQEGMKILARILVASDLHTLVQDTPSQK